MKGATLRRPARWWISTLASACALAVALALMAMADEIQPARPPQRVFSLPAGPPVDHQGGGVALPRGDGDGSENAVATSTTPIARPTTRRTAAQLAAAKQPSKKTPRADEIVTVVGSTSTTTAPSTPTTGPHIRLPGPGIDDVGGHKPHVPHKPREPKAPRPPKHPKPPKPPRTSDDNQFPCVLASGYEGSYEIDPTTGMPFCSDPDDTTGGLAPDATTGDPTVTAPPDNPAAEDGGNQSSDVGSGDETTDGTVQRVLDDTPF